MIWPTGKSLLLYARRIRLGEKMSVVAQQIFQNKKINFTKLLPFGFQQTDHGHVYYKTLEESGFLMEVCIDGQGNVTTQVVDPLSGEPYTLHLVENSAGQFVGKVKKLYEQTLAEIAERCCEPDVFHTIQAQALIAHIHDVYGDELEFLWPQFPQSAIWRRKDSRKWYASLNRVSARKLGLPSDMLVEIVNLCDAPEIVSELIDRKAYFPAYHMNKKHWYSVLLNGSATLAEIYQKVERSYQHMGNKSR